MKVLIPGQKNANSFFEEMTVFSRHTFDYGSLDLFEPLKYDLVLIQWPETLADWEKPTNDILKELRKTLQKWKESCKIIYLVHNIKSHYSCSENYRLLYDMVESNCDTMVHFGEFSHNIFFKKYPQKRHFIIPHPLYRRSSLPINRNSARKKLGLKESSIVIIAPGKIRNRQEMKMIVNSFEALEVSDKVLLVPFMYRKEVPINFPGRHKLKPFLDVKKQLESLVNRDFNTHKFLVDYFRKDITELSIWISAADIVLVPRFNVLNSGVVFLGLTHRKVLVGPKSGNISEVLNQFNFPVFKNSSIACVSEAVKSAVKLIEESVPFPAVELKKYEPVNVAKEWDDMLCNLV